MQKRTVSVASSVGVAVFGVALVAQQPAAQPPVRKHAHDLEASYIRMPLPPSEAAYGRLQGDHIKEFDKAIVAFSLKDRDEGNLLWGRIAGTKNDELVEA